ncbi:hypothetical protein ABZS66_45655 [Dactylosporangium sp. NPDC005572]|uniref:hypothetical protein n=1 Tax=Dactylosporangium sp. NPDC005572 TaxID=3156889 RepID=UPI0033BB6CB2
MFEKEPEVGALTTWRIVVEAAADDTTDGGQLTVLLAVSGGDAGVVATTTRGANPPSVDVEMLSRAVGLAPRTAAPAGGRRSRNIRGGCATPTRDGAGPAAH